MNIMTIMIKFGKNWEEHDPKQMLWVSTPWIWRQNRNTSVTGPTTPTPERPYGRPQNVLTSSLVSFTPSSSHKAKTSSGKKLETPNVKLKQKENKRSEKIRNNEWLLKNIFKRNVDPLKHLWHSLLAIRPLKGDGPQYRLGITTRGMKYARVNLTDRRNRMKV